MIQNRAVQIDIAQTGVANVLVCEVCAGKIGAGKIDAFEIISIRPQKNLARLLVLDLNHTRALRPIRSTASGRMESANEK